MQPYLFHYIFNTCNSTLHVSVYCLLLIFVKMMYGKYVVLSHPSYSFWNNSKFWKKAENKCN